jgi:SAM-dependent methyltransferase
MGATVFDRLVWESDAVARLDDLAFRIEQVTAGGGALGLDDGCFTLGKTRPHLEEYRRYWSSRPDFEPSNVFELGIFDGGSVALWFELFQPRMHVGVDLATDRDTRYFERYVRSRGLEDRIAAHWGTDQSDKDRLWEIVREEFDAPLDLVIDDACHLYRPTRSSLEALFPLLRPGGLYVIEDWAWGHWLQLDPPRHPDVHANALTRLVGELTAVLGTAEGVVEGIDARRGFVVIERGPAELEQRGFTLDRHVAWAGTRLRSLRWRAGGLLRVARRTLRRG